MKPGAFDLDVYQGDTYERTFRLRQRVLDVDGVTYIPGAYLDLTGYTARSQIRDTPIAASISATATVTVLNQVTTPGGIKVVFSAAQTAALANAKYFWDLEITSPSAVVSTVLAGAVNVTQEVTRT
jgi:hypothetical protein